jgi:hypothetical protein
LPAAFAGAAGVFAAGFAGVFVLGAGFSCFAAAVPDLLVFTVFVDLAPPAAIFPPPGCFLVEFVAMIIDYSKKPQKNQMRFRVQLCDSVGFWRGG